MSLFIAIVLLLSLCWGEFCAAERTESWLALTIGATLLALLCPTFAAVQMFIAKRRHARQEAGKWFPRFRTIAIAHTIFWAAASAVITIWLPWSAIVVHIPLAKSIPLADDLILIAPALVSLIASWAIFIFGAPAGSLAKNKTRGNVFRLWLRMQVAMVTAPILFAFFVTDCLALAAATELSPISQVISWALCGLALTACFLFYPQMMLFVWSTQRNNDKPLDTRCKKLFEQAGIRPRLVRVWKTGNSIVNAAAVGIVPGTEVIIVSDMLLDKFSEQEVDAILLHEIGHIKHHHCIRRIAMVLIPLVLLAIDQATGFGLHYFVGESSILSNTFGAAASLIPAFAFVGYLLIIFKTVFRRMEFEADQFAAETIDRTGERCPVESALEKMAVIYPRQIDRRSGLHPSIRQRLAFVIDVNARIHSEKTPLNPCVPSPKTISLDPVAAK